MSDSSVVSALRRQGRDDVGVYFGNHARLADWRLESGWLDGREILCVFRPAGARQPSWFVEVTPAGDRIAIVRDYHHVPYIMHEADIRRG
jgi:RNA polymerase sigma-70 factor (ECF subfamily)